MTFTYPYFSPKVMVKFTREVKGHFVTLSSSPDVEHSISPQASTQLTLVKSGPTTVTALVRSDSPFLRTFNRTGAAKKEENRAT